MCFSGRKHRRGSEKTLPDRICILKQVNAVFLSQKHITLFKMYIV